MFTRFVAAGLFALPAMADSSIAVFGIAATDVPEEAARAFTDELRARFAAGGYALAPPKELVEVALVFCEGAHTPACLARAGKSIGAGKVVAGTLKGGRPASLYIEMIDVERGQAERGVKDHSVGEVTQDAMRALAVWVYGELSGEPVAAPAPPRDTPPVLAAAAPVAGPATVRVRHVNELGASYRMVGASYEMDGRPVFTAVDEDGLPGGGTFVVLDAALPPGPHVLTGLEVYRGESTLLPYLREYRLTVRPAYRFTVEPAEGTTVDVVSCPSGGILAAWEDRVRTSVRTGAGRQLAAK
jgi:hypothetical protein